MPSLVERAGVVEAAQTWRCDESRADPEDVPEPHDVPLWEPQPRFTAVVDRVEEDYVELTVATGNSHPRTPAFGAEIVSTVATLTSDPRWSLIEDGEVDDVQ
ncbi:SNF2/RAD54 family helicase [Halorubrum sp. C3]|nr:SNF2/RAD54 family helicase [Halorubrum sp. C3]